jgi:hypothetical protein
MITVVHGEKIRNCQWTGEPIRKVFKIPTKNGKDWKGCYGSPSTCVSAIQALAEDEHLQLDEYHELLDLFQATIRLSPGYEKVVFTINPAPSFRMLKMWGGSLPLEAYHETYDHDKQVIMYYQEIKDSGTEPKETKSPEKKPTDEKDTEEDFDMKDFDDEGVPNAPKKWHMESIMPGTSQTLVPSKVTMPRGGPTWVDFLKSNNPSKVVKNSVIVYFHPTNDKIFAIGSPVDYNEIVNKRAAACLGHAPVFGQVFLFHKKKIREKKKTDESQ